MANNLGTTSSSFPLPSLTIGQGTIYPPILQSLPDIVIQSIRIVPTGQKLASKVKVISSNRVEIADENHYNERLNTIYKVLKLKGFSRREEECCKRIIDYYLLVPGYNQLRSFLASIKKGSFEDTSLEKIYKFLQEVAEETDEIKRYVETEDRKIEDNLFVQNLPAMLQWAEETHASLDARFEGQEELPSFNPNTLQVVCSLEQLEFATHKVREFCASFMRLVKSEHEVAHMTQLVQIILCGHDAKRDRLPLNPVCIILRETSKESDETPKNGINAENEATVSDAYDLIIPLLPNRCSATINESSFHIQSHSSHAGQADIDMNDWEHPFDTQWVRNPVACMDFVCCSTTLMPSSSHSSSSSQEAASATLKVSKLCVNWAAPQKFFETLVCLVRDPQVEPHKFTHPLTGKHLNQFADSVLDLYHESILPEIEEVTSKIILSPTAISTYKRKRQRENEKILNAFQELKKGITSELKYFLDHVIEILTNTSSQEDFEKKLRELTNKKEYEEKFLNQLCALIKDHLPSLVVLAQYRARYRKIYEAALLTAMEGHLHVRKALSREDYPSIDPITGSMTVSFVRFRLAKMLFDFHYSQLLEFADNQEEEAYASHILAILLCGSDAPVPGRLINNPRCFVIRTTFDLFQTLYDNTIVSFIQDIFKSIVAKKGTPDEDEYDKCTEDEKFNRSFKDAIKRFLADQIDRNPYQLAFGNMNYRTQIIDEDDLKKPLYILEILENYRNFLIANPEIARQMRKDPFFNLVSDRLSVERFAEVLSEFSQESIPRLVVQKINLFLRALPILNQDLVLLKFLELMSLINQNISRIICAPFEVRILSIGSIVLKESNLVNFTFPSIACDAVRCQGMINFYSFDSNSDSLNQNIDILPGRKCVAQVGLRMEVPSLTGLDKEGNRRPMIAYFPLAFSAFAPLALVDIASSVTQPNLQREIYHCDQKWLRASLKGVIAQLAELDDFFQGSDKEAAVAFASDNFSSAFQLINKLKIVQLISKDQPALDSESKQIKKDLEVAVIKLRGSYQKLKQYADANPSHNLSDCMMQILKWFPHFKSNK